MKTTWILLIIAGSGTLLLTEPTFAQSIVYDNTATYLGTARPAYIEDGNEVTLAGDQRLVTSVAIAVEITGDAPATFSAQLTLYANDGAPDGRPGTLLWRSDVIPQQIEPGAPRFIPFAIPRVRVPNTFIWTAQFHPTETQVSLSQFHPPGVGSVRFGYWWYNLGPTEWLFRDWDAPFGAVITVAAPIPAISTWGVLLLTLALVSAGVVVISRANSRDSNTTTLRKLTKL